MAKRLRRKYSGIGGQAVLEGVMMMNANIYAVAVRKPNGEIEVEKTVLKGNKEKAFCRRAPFIRGVFQFINSLTVGNKALQFSTSFFEEDEKKEKSPKMTKFKEKMEPIVMALTTLVAFVIAIAGFMVLPYLLTDFFAKDIHNQFIIAVIEGVIRIAIFIAYVVLISLMKDIKRLYMYHGAEHKCIDCIETGHPLTVENVLKSSKVHKRCGTSFMLFVMLVSIVVFFFINVDSMVLRIVLRIALVPVIAGISYEIIRLAGRTENIILKIISAPGLWMQGLTTKEPDASMAEVAIASVEAVFDWRAFLTKEFGYVEEVIAETDEEQDYDYDDEDDL